MDPQRYFLSSMPNLFQATKFMVAINIGSTHTPDEEYIGERNDKTAWLGEPEIMGAFNQFSMEIKNIENEIQRRNNDPTLRNRCGAGVPPYELLMPSSESGATGRGVPNSATM
jgi:lipoxygenase